MTDADATINIDHSDAKENAAATWTDLLRYSTKAPLLFRGSVNTVAIALAGILVGIGILSVDPRNARTTLAWP